MPCEVWIASLIGLVIGEAALLVICYMNREVETDRRQQGKIR